MASLGSGWGCAQPAESLGSERGVLELGRAQELVTGQHVASALAQSGDTLLATLSPNAFFHTGSTWQDQPLPADCLPARFVALDGDTGLIGNGEQTHHFRR